MTTTVSRPSSAAHPIHPLLAARWSPRAIDPTKPVSLEEINRLLEAARWAPSAFNNQSWHYLLLTSPEALAQGREALAPGNAWALQAPLLIYSLVSKRFRVRDALHPLGDYELGMATISMAFQANSMGLVFHQMMGFDAKVVERNFQIDPERYRIATAIAVGYPGEIEQLPPDKLALETAARERIPSSEFSHFERW